MSVRVRLSAFVVSTLVCAAAVGCGNTAPPPVEVAEQVAPANPLVGSWSVATMTPADGSGVIDPAQPGLFIFGPDGYYSMVYTLGADPRVPSATPFEPTDEEMVAQHQSIIVNTGGYEVSGSTVTTRPMVAKSPGYYPGGYATNEFTVVGDTLTLTQTAVVFADGTPATGPMGNVMTLRRLP